MNSPIKWMGGKFRLRKQIIKMIPQHVCYCEPFGGAAWVLFGKEPSKVEVYNDINGELVNFFRVIQSRPEEFIHAFDSVLISREQFNRFKALNLTGADEVKRAVRFFYLLNYSFGALMKDFLISPSRRPARVLENLESIVTSARSRLINTIIENRDFEVLIKSYDRQATFFYCDPPYYGLTDYKSQGSQAFLKEDHVRLSSILRNLKGKFLLSINDHPNIRELYKGFQIEPVSVKYTVSKSTKNVSYDELFISNRA